MTTLTFDLSELDQELDNLLEHRWTVKLIGENADGNQRVIAPPPSKTVLDYPWSTAGTMTEFVLLCDAQVIKRWHSVLRFIPGDVLHLTLILT